MPLRFLGGHKADEAAGGPTASHAGSMISAMFLLIFAIAVIVPWTVADSARQNTYTEAGALEETAWAARGLSPNDAAATRAALRDYAQFVAAVEWRAMKRGQLDPRGWQRLDGLRSWLTRLDLKDQNQQYARDAVVGQLQTVYAARRQRALDAQTAVPWGVLALTVVTAVFVVLFPLLAGVRPRGWVWVAYALLAINLAVGVYLVFAIHHTFYGPLGVGPKAFTTAWAELGRVP